jgi:hypothetical protein
MACQSAGALGNSFCSCGINIMATTMVCLDSNTISFEPGILPEEWPGKIME